ncbi:MAG: hypothetical protein HS113_05980 [Verrucomicrobiales bacterium]|nr:hypothetical protein [Verrucomicrobiales bacterium]
MFWNHLPWSDPARSCRSNTLDRLLTPCLPPGLLTPADEGPNRRERVFSLRPKVIDGTIVSLADIPK